MNKRAAENLLEFLSDPENYDKEVVEKNVSEKKKRREEVRQRILNCLERAETAEAKRKEVVSGERKETTETKNRFEEGKRKQEEFNKYYTSAGFLTSGSANANTCGYQINYREGEKASEDEKKAAEERDRKAMEVFKKIRNGEGKK